MRTDTLNGWGAMDSTGVDGRLGVVTDGSFTAGLTVRLDGTPPEDLQVGSFVVLDGERNRYFSLVTDVQLKATDPAIVADPPVESPFVQAALRGIHTYAAAIVRPSLVLEDAGNLVEGGRPRAVRTIPTHFAVMRRARGEDFDVVFGAESNTRFSIGSPIAMDDVRIPIDLEKFIERSSGIFGQTGTGKSVLTRLVLFGLIRSRLASSLVFDMHGEYADARPDKPHIPGLRDLFSTTEIKVYSLDQRNTSAQYHIRIGLNHIMPEDIELLKDELDLNDTFFATSHLLFREFRERWLQRLFELDAEGLKEFAARSGAHLGAVEALKRKLTYLEDRGYVVTHSADDPVRDIVQHLRQGRHVIIEFGPRFGLKDYLLVANLLTRRIHEVYTQDDSIAGASGRRQSLVVVLEEAHKFLNPAAAKQSIFGTIAREMRKFGVSLLVVDQRPSGIDSEVLSQLGTRISGLLTDESDIAAVLSGTGDRNALRAMLASLEPTQQCLVLGHAIPMPMILRTREYGFGLRDLLDAEGARRKLGVDLLLGSERRTA